MNSIIMPSRTSKSILCFAQGTKGDWRGICLDLDIAVQGRSFEDVKTALETAIETYVQDARAEGDPNTTQLLSRSAPWHVRAYYVAAFLIGTLFRRDNTYRHAFSLPSAP